MDPFIAEQWPQNERHHTACIKDTRAGQAEVSSFPVSGMTVKKWTYKGGICFQQRDKVTNEVRVAGKFNVLHVAMSFLSPEDKREVP
jgi:hypothetical protein